MEIALLILLGLAAGTLGSLLGLGGGFLVVPALILLRGTEARDRDGHVGRRDRARDADGALATQRTTATWTGARRV